MAITISSGTTVISTVIASGTDYVVEGSGTLDVVNGGTVSGLITITSGGISGATVNVSSGGATLVTIIDAAGFQNVFSSAAATNTTINSGGRQEVFDGGAAISTTITGGVGVLGFQVVDNGGTAISTTIGSGTQNVAGTAVSTTVNDGGRQEVEDGGTAISTTINSGGLFLSQQIVDGGGIAISTTINLKGQQSVGGTAISTTISGSGGLQGVQNVNNSGTAISTTISSGGLQNVMNGGTATGTTISGGKQEVFAGGTAIGTTINSAGQMPPTTNLQDVNGTAIGTTINSRGLQAVEPGGTAISTTIIGGQQNVFSGAATSTTISGGEQLVEFFGTATSTTISGGEQVVETGGIAISTIVSSGGSEIVSSGSTAIGTTISDATEYVSSGGTAIGVIFAGASGTLDLVRPQGLSGTISGWQVGDVLDFVSTNLASVGISGSQLSVTVSGGTTFVYQLAGQEANTSASIQSDGAGGSDVVLSSVPQNISKGHTLIVSHGQPRLRWRRKLIVASGGTADPVTINSGGIEVSGQLRIADAAGSSTVFSGTISGFGGASHANKKQSIDLVDVAFTSGAITSRYVSSGGNTTGTLFVSSGGTEVAAINFVGSYTAANFHISSGGVGVIITDPGVVNGGVVTDGLAQAFPNQGIDLPNIAFSAHTTLAYAENAAGTGGTLTVSDGRHAASIALLGNYIAGSFAAAPDGHGGTLVTQLQPQQQPLLTHPQA